MTDAHAMYSVDPLRYTWKEDTFLVIQILHADLLALRC